MNAKTNSSTASSDAVLAAMFEPAPEADTKEVRPSNVRARGDRPADRQSSASNSQQGGDIEDEDLDDEDDAPVTKKTGKQPVEDDEDDEADDDQDEQESDDDEGDEDDDDLDSLFGGAADQDGDDEGKGDDFDTSKLGENAKFSVTVDGEEVQVTLGELRRRYAGEGAIEKRLQVATETRQKASEDYDKGKQLITNVLQTFGQALFRRTVPQPDPELRRTNLPAYLEQKDYYDQETEALKASHGQLYAMMENLDQHFAAARKKARQDAAVEVKKMFPALNDPAKAPRIKQVLLDTAREIGYTDAQLADVTDPLFFKAIALAAKEMKRAKSVKSAKPEERIRTIKKSNERSPQSATKRRETKALDKARKTRNADDILATMFETVKKPRRR